MANPFQTLVITQRGAGVAQITMSRPQVFNAFDEVMIGELDAAFTQLSQDEAVRVIVDRKSTRLNSSHIPLSRMPSSA